MKVWVYAWALAALYGVTEADVRAVLQSPSSRTVVQKTQQLGDWHMEGSLDAKGAARFIAALEDWAYLPQT